MSNSSSTNPIPCILKKGSIEFVLTTRKFTKGIPLYGSSLDFNIGQPLRETEVIPTVRSDNEYDKMIKGLNIFEKTLNDNNGDVAPTVEQLKDAFVFSLTALVGPSISEESRAARIGVVMEVSEDMRIFSERVEEIVQAIIDKEGDGYDHFTAMELVAEKLGVDVEVIQKHFCNVFLQESSSQ